VPLLLDRCLQGKDDRRVQCKIHTERNEVSRKEGSVSKKTTQIMGMFASIAVNSRPFQEMERSVSFMHEAQQTV